MAEYEVTIPEGVNVAIKGDSVTVRGKQELTRSFDLKRLTVKQDSGKITLTTKSDRVKDKAFAGAVASHIKNMVTGSNNNYTYKLKICYAHFPINVSVDKNMVVIKNFCGEKIPRPSKIQGATKVEVKGQDITVTGPCCEDVSQTAANIEQATKLGGRDTRRFQDGIFITSKGD